MAAPAAIVSLVERFHTHLLAYKRTEYGETQVRVEYIDPFFEALGWDVHNRNGYAEAYKDVVHEDAVRIGGVLKAPDYGFRLSGQRKFFVEAKKPSVDVRGDISPAYQLRRYAWSAKLPLSILTDFEEFAVYDCRVKPEKHDLASAARVKYLRYTDYAEKWDEIAAIFARENILKGSFDAYAESNKLKRGTAEVDDAFLAEIEKWRDALARSIALRNPAISTRELNYAVQQTIDRIVFLRICEARGLEQYGALQGLSNGSSIYPRLVDLFRVADMKYNSGLFHFHTEKGQAGDPDELTPALQIDDKVLKEILTNLYYPDCPYEFQVLPADILGQIYEQFLGKVIRLTAGHQARVEEKPEVKKAGGVYYTPTYIVDYIVRQTVGKLVEGKKPGPKGGVSKLRIVDPACGSGSFLIGAYQFLLDWHLNAYVADEPEQWARKGNPQLYQTGKGEWRLTLDERKRILLNNIFGVDIDAQAVEVTKLSLLLKVLEGESGETLRPQMQLLPDRVLPDLARNIRCGNSLIGPDYYAAHQMTLLDEDEMVRVNVFDWHAAFAEVFAEGGFDAVIGNPPYIRPHNLPAGDKEYFWGHFSTFVKKSDIYCCFMERAVEILRQNGLLGFIVSDGWLRLDSFDALRLHLLTNTEVKRIVDFDGDVFEDAVVRTCIVLLRKHAADEKTVVEVQTTAPGHGLDMLTYGQIPQAEFLKTYKHIFDLSIDNKTVQIKERIWSLSLPLGKLYLLSFGLKTGDDLKFLSFDASTADHRRLLRGANIHRYSVNFSGEYVWYVPQLMTNHRRTARPGTAERFEQPKVLIRDTGGGLHGTYDEAGFFVKDVIVVSHPDKDIPSLKYLIGLLNSRLLRYYHDTSFPTLHVQSGELSSLPIHFIDNADVIGRQLFGKIVAAVQQMLDLHAKLQSTTLPHLKEAYRAQIAATDRQIDELVYELYGLTDKEVAIVEGHAEAAEEPPAIEA